jgi:glutamate synthase (ferredoxin)
MSGGFAYVHDADGNFPSRVNGEMVDIMELTDPAEIEALKAIIAKQVRYTGSSLGKRILAGWAGAVKRFVKVAPRDYSRMLAAIDKARGAGLSGDDALMAAFDQNNLDLARVAGN